jgi:hypothetical protein
MPSEQEMRNTSTDCSANLVSDFGSYGASVAFTHHSSYGCSVDCAHDIAHGAANEYRTVACSVFCSIVDAFFYSVFCSVFCSTVHALGCSVVYTHNSR